MNNFINKLKIKVREILNPCLGRIRQHKLNRTDFTIVSNNCWGGHVYRYFNLPYNSPFIGMYILSEDYIKLINNLRHYIESEIEFVNIEDSIHSEEIKSHGGNSLTCPIGRIDDIEIVFLHYKTVDEARTKWNKRKQRIVWDNIVYKMSEMNNCKKEHIMAFDKIPESRKFILTVKDYNISSQIICNEWSNYGQIKDDTTNFRKYVDLINFINGNPFRKH